MKLLLLLLASCALPDEYTVSTGYAQSEFDNRPVHEFDTMGLMVGATWTPGAKKRHTESLEAIRRLEVTTATGRLQPMPVQDAADSDDAEPDLTDFLDKPEDPTDALVYLIWAVSIAIVGFTGAHLYKSGALDRLLPKKKDPK